MKSKLKLKIAVVLMITIGASAYGYSCSQKKQCCKRDYTGSLVCVTKCDYEMCPYNYPTEIR